MAENHPSGLGSHPSLACLGTPSKLDSASLQGTLLTQEVGQRWRVWGLGLSKAQLDLLSATQFPCVLDTGDAGAPWAFDPASCPLNSLPPLPA